MCLLGPKLARNVVFNVHLTPITSIYCYLDVQTTLCGYYFFLEVSQAFKAVLKSTQHAGYGVPLGNVYSVFLTSPRELKPIADEFMVRLTHLSGMALKRREEKGKNPKVRFGGER